MKYAPILLLALFCASFCATAQIQVRNEPRHHNVIENKYFRVLDVHIPPHDTTLQHMHSTTSVILIFSTTQTGAQLKGHDWAKSKSVAGSAFYSDFQKDTVIHRVGNFDTVPFHVADIELLSAYHPGDGRKPLPMKVIFDAEKAFAYHVPDTSLNKKTIITNRGPMIAGLVSGDNVILHDTTHGKTVTLKEGKEIYIEPGISFYLSATGKKPTDLVLFEIK